MINLIKLTSQYASLNAKEVAIKLEKKQVGMLIQERIKKIGALQYGTVWGLFTIYKTPTYEFSPRVKKKEAEVEQIKNIEKENGTARITYTEAFRFTPKK